MEVGRHVEGRPVITPVTVSGTLTSQDMPEELSLRRNNKHSSRSGGPDNAILIHLHSVGSPRILPGQGGAVEEHFLGPQGSIRLDIP